MSFLSTPFDMFAASEQRDADIKAQDKNIQAAKDRNEANLKMFREMRGSTGSAILPTYLKDANGNLFEGNVLGRNMVDVYQKAYDSLTPDEQLAQGKAILSTFQPTQDMANATVQGVFDGRLTNEELAAQGDVQSARMQGVASRKQSGLEALAQTLNEIGTIQAGKGYSGDSFGNRLLKANALRTTYGQAATDSANANIQGAQERQAIKDQGIGRKLNSLSLPYAMAQQNINMETLPQNATLDQEGRRQQLTNVFRIGTDRFTYDPLPQVKPIMSQMGMFSAIQGQNARDVGKVVGKAAAAYFTGGSSLVNSGDGF